MLNYKEVLERIETRENHLLLGNGFNRGLGINTGYQAIFQKMTEKHHSLYSDALDIVIECDYDLESFIGRMESDIRTENTFIRNFIKNRIKFDFMQATHEIVKAELKNIYAEKNEGIYVLLKHFTNYFTLNFDSFLYLLLLKYKPRNNEDMNAIAFEPSITLIKEDQNERHEEIYTEIKTARDKGTLRINFGFDNSIIEKAFNKTTQQLFIASIKEYAKANDKKWKDKDIKYVVNKIFDDEKRLSLLNRIDDGSRQHELFNDQSEFLYHNTKTQNVFFLHGAFHIYRDGKRIKKITKQSDKALYDKLEDVLNNEEQEIVCVFQYKDKLDVIKENKYLTQCLVKLKQIAGNLVIIGSSLADNDSHIFKEINSSQVEAVYISTLPEKEKVILEQAHKFFPQKQIYIFDAKSISYELPAGAE